MKKSLLFLLITAFFLNLKVSSQITVYTNNNVGVKTTVAPSEALEVNGNAKATYFIGDGSKLTNLPSSGSSQWTTSSSNIYYSLGKVGIGTTGPLSTLSINGAGDLGRTIHASHTSSQTYGTAIYGICEQASTNSYRTGIWGHATIATSGSSLSRGIIGSSYVSNVLTTGKSCGVEGIAGNATTGYNYGVWGFLTGSNNGAAIYAMTPGQTESSVPGIYAGYFRGKVYLGGDVGINVESPSCALDISGTAKVSGVVITSDERLKKDITDINNNLAMVSKLRGVSYFLKSPNEVNSSLRTLSINTVKSDTSQQVTESKMMKIDSELYSRQHIGFLAQDVQKVFPEIVYEDKDGILSVDYISLIPVLVESMKELNEKVEKLQTENDNLKKKLGTTN